VGRNIYALAILPSGTVRSKSHINTSHDLGFLAHEGIPGEYPFSQVKELCQRPDVSKFSFSLAFSRMEG